MRAKDCLPHRHDRNRYALTTGEMRKIIHYIQIALWSNYDEIITKLQKEYPEFHIPKQTNETRLQSIAWYLEGWGLKPDPNEAEPHA